MLLSDAIDEYAKVRQRHVKPVTAKQDENACRMVLASIGNIQISNVKASHVERFFYGEAKATGASVEGYADRVGAATFNNVLGKFKAFLRWCERRGYIRRDLLEEIRAQVVIRRERMRLSPNQLIALLDLADHPRDRMIIALAENLGCRASEIVTIKISDINLDAGTIRAQVHKSSLEDTKNITKELDQELRRWLLYYMEAPKNTYKQILQDEWYLVPSLRRWNTPDFGETHSMGEVFYPLVTCKSPARGVKRALAKLGLDGPGEGLHTIRRSVARAYFESQRSMGYDGALQNTAAFLNHSSAQTTERYLGLTHERQIRDETLRGKPFLSAMVSGENVVKIADARRETTA